MRVDNLERSVQLLVEREPEQGWMIVDPLRAPAEAGLIELLLEALTTQTAYPVEDAEPRDLALDPPRAVLEFDEQVGAERLSRRLELGLVDLDGQHAFVRADGRLVRTLRTFESILDRSADDWRTRSIVRGLQAMEVVEVRRRGSLALAAGAAEVPLDLALVQDDGWYATEPWRALLDPGAVGLLVQSACALRATDFVDDSPVDLGVYGLAEPALELELLEASGRRELLRFAPKDGDEWYAAASSDPRVYAIAREALLGLAFPADQMVERDFARLVRERVARVALGSEGRELVLEQVAGRLDDGRRPGPAASGRRRARRGPADRPRGPARARAAAGRTLRGRPGGAGEHPDRARRPHARGRPRGAARDRGRRGGDPLPARRGRAGHAARRARAGARGERPRRLRGAHARARERARAGAHRAGARRAPGELRPR